LTRRHTRQTRKTFHAYGVIFLLVRCGAAAESSSGTSPTKTRQSPSKHGAALKSLFPGIQGNAVDHTSGTAVLVAWASTDGRAKVLAKKRAAEMRMGVPVRIDIIGAPVKQQ
jgi:hypothetical protein